MTNFTMAQGVLFVGGWRLLSADSQWPKGVLVRVVGGVFPQISQQLDA